MQGNASINSKLQNPPPGQFIGHLTFRRLARLARFIDQSSKYWLNTKAIENQTVKEFFTTLTFYHLSQEKVILSLR